MQGSFAESHHSGQQIAPVLSGAHTTAEAPRPTSVRRAPSFAVIYFSEPLADNDVMIPKVKARFETFVAAEAYRVHHFGADNESFATVED